MPNLFLLLCNVWVLHWTLMDLNSQYHWDMVVWLTLLCKSRTKTLRNIGCKLKSIEKRKYLVSYSWPWITPKLIDETWKDSIVGKQSLKQKSFYYERVTGSLMSASDMSCSLKCQEHWNVSICTKQSPRKKIISSVVLSWRKNNYNGTVFLTIF